MKTYLVTFEISDEDNLSKLKEIMKEESGYYCPIHRNAWAIRSEKKASELRDSLAKLISTDDSIFVLRSGTEAAWENSYGIENDDWLKKYL